MRVHHFAIATTDPVRLAEFYERVLGLVPVREHRMDDGQIRSVWFDLESILLMIERSGSGAHATSALGYSFLALSIAPSERDSWRQRLGQAGVPIANESDYTLYFFDPDGNRIGLSHYPVSAVKR